MQWPSDAPGSIRVRRRQACVHRKQAWEHLGAPTQNLGAPTNTLGAPTTSLGARQITVVQSGNDIIFRNAAVVPENHSYFLSFKDFLNSCIQFVFSSMYLCIYIHTVSLDWLLAVVETN